ncbi:spore-associated protein A [Streptomyces sp. NPDC002181]|uniref:spore-associated protein A n=1 Tax=unclassified Streptomyces TaxID=2593676 RepID=UPI00366A463F
MKRIVRNTLATITGVVAVSALAAVPAEAQTVSGGSCGAGYYQQDAYPLGDSQGATGAGVIFLYYNSSTGKNCAILRRDANFLVSDGMDISIDSSSGGTDVDGQRAYTTYAGPVYVSARGACVRMTAHITGAWKNSAYLPKTHSENTGWVHCG